MTPRDLKASVIAGGRRVNPLKLLPFSIIIVVTVVLILSWRGADDGQVAAHAPHAALNFSIAVDVNGDTTNDCSTNGGPLGCSLATGSSFTLRVYLNNLPNGVPSYEGFDIYLEYAGVTSKNNASSAPWPNCANAASSYSSGTVTFGCAVSSGAPPSSYVGLIGTSAFNCPATPATGTITLTHAVGKTQLIESGSSSAHAEGAGTTEGLTINCGTGGGPTPNGQISVQTSGLYADGVHEFACKADAVVVVTRGQISGFKARTSAFSLQEGDNVPALASQDGAFVLSVGAGGAVRRGPRDCVEVTR